MPVYENHADRVKQQAVASRIQQHLESLPVGRVDVRMTPQSRMDSHDLDVYLSGLYVGVVEVKCRDYDEAFFLREGWMIDVERLRSLRKQFFNTPSGRWTKSVTLALNTLDGALYLIGLDKVVREWSNFRKADPEMLTDDHGAKPAATRKDGVIIPLEYMTKLL